MTHRRYWLPQISQTFQGRDILAPVAAYLASGGSLRHLGVSTRMRDLVPLELPPWRRQGSQIEGQVIHIDSFGNLITNLPGSLLNPSHPPSLKLRRDFFEAHSAQKGRADKATVKQKAKFIFKGKHVPVVSSYRQGRKGQLVALVGSLGWIELALRQDSAAKRLKARRGERVVLNMA